MSVLPVDLVALVSAVMGISIVLFPVIGITFRFAVKPAVEALTRAFEHRQLDETVNIMERRMGLMEQQIQALESTMERLVEVTEFHNQLQSGGEKKLATGDEPAKGSAG